MRALLTWIGNLFRLLLAPLWLGLRAIARPRARFVRVKLASSPVEIAERLTPWERILRRRDPNAGRLSSIDTLWRIARAIADDPQTDGMVVFVPHLSAGWAACASVRAPLVWLKQRGKHVVMFLPLGGSQRELYVASAGSRIVAPPSASFWTLGASAQTMYVKPLLDRIGVSAEVFATGDYKTAAEPFTHEAMSAAQEEQLRALAASVQLELERAFGERPGMDASRVARCFERAAFRGEAAVEAGLLDACRYEDELVRELPGYAPDPKRSATVEHARYLAYRQARLWRSTRVPPAIGVVAVHGPIVDSAPRLTAKPPASFEGVARALRAARKDRSVRAVILHIDSPGGSALASDLIHRELLRLREKKPLIACMANVAASGGYYVASACQRIVAQPTTTTGSIGVISARVLAADAIERIGLRPQTVSVAPHADMLSPFRVLTDTERALLTDQVKGFYGAFLAVVAVGRGQTPEQIDVLARGRVWSGQDAHRHGLVDVLGGLERAVEEVIALTPDLQKLPRGEIALRFVRAAGEQAPAEPAHEPHAEQLAELRSLLLQRDVALYYAPTPKLGV